MVKIQVNSQGKAYIANGKALEAQSGGSAPVIEPLSVTPTTSAQTITAPSGTDGYSPVNVAAVTASIDSDIKASNIKSGVSILGVTGTVTELNGETRTATLTSLAGNTFTPSSGKNAITSITVTPNNQARSVTPSTSSQTLSVNSGYSGNGTISVSAVTSSIDANIQAGNIKKDVQILGVTGTYEGSSGKYQLLDRVKDNTNEEIGTVSGFFTDVNNVEYAVVCLDAQYRSASLKYSTTAETVTNMPLYNNLVTANAWESKATATENTYLITTLLNSPACAHCLDQIFTINSVQYHGQLPNLKELSDIVSHYNAIEQLDTSASSYPNTNFSSPRSLLQSNQHTETNVYCYTAGSCAITGTVNKTTARFVCPVLEIPNQ